MFLLNDTLHLIVFLFASFHVFIMITTYVPILPVSGQVFLVNNPTPYPTARITYVHGIPVNEYKALDDFYESLGGEYWTWQRSDESGYWNFTSTANPCYDDWQGLTCDCTNDNDEEDCHITEIDLQRYNLTGIIPSSIFNLNFLTSLELGNNYIIDPLPETLQNLTLLTILSLSSNNLTIMSPVIYSCFHLTSLILSSNQISDTLSPKIANLTRLKLIHLQYNNFYSSLPIEFYHNLTSLKEVVLSNNQFTGTIPKDIENLQDLVDYEIGGNAFFGSIPEEFPFSELLTDLHLGPNLFSQTLPKSFQNATLIESLVLTSNSFTGPYVFLSSNTHELDLANNFFVGSTNDFLNDNSAAVLHLQDLILSNNLFTGSTSLSLSRYPGLAAYVLAINYFTGPFLCSSLKSELLLEVILGNNYFSGSLSSNLTMIPTQLTQLNVSRNFFSGEVISITFFQNPLNTGYIYLQKFDFSNNFFINRLPDLCIGSTLLLDDLYFVSFSNNAFTGSIPTNYSRFNISADLFFNDNLLSGPLSEVLSLFTDSKVVNLELSNNIFTGSLSPTSFFSSNRKMTLFDVSNNCLTGSIPENVCDLHDIETFNLDGSSSSSHCRILLFPDDSIFNSFISENSLEGSIPSCLFSLPTIQTLHLSGNGLTGSLPSNLDVSTSLVDLSLSYNLLTGSIPVSLQVKSNWQSLDLSYNKFSGTLSSSFATQNEMMKMIHLN
jgi:LRR receptor-like serine/threonine-protein kinase FLS2